MWEHTYAFTHHTHKWNTRTYRYAHTRPSGDMHKYKQIVCTLALSDIFMSTWLIINHWHINTRWRYLQELPLPHRHTCTHIEHTALVTLWLQPRLMPQDQWQTPNPPTHFSFISLTYILPYQAHCSVYYLCDWAVASTWVFTLLILHFNISIHPPYTPLTPTSHHLLKHHLVNDRRITLKGNYLKQWLPAENWKQ